MTNGTDKDIGRLEGKMDMLIDQVKTVHIKLDRMETHGCAKGETNEKALESQDVRIKRLEGMALKALAIAIAIVAGGHGADKLISFLMK